MEQQIYSPQHEKWVYDQGTAEWKMTQHPLAEPIDGYILSNDATKVAETERTFEVFSTEWTEALANQRRVYYVQGLLSKLWDTNSAVAMIEEISAKTGVTNLVVVEFMSWIQLES